MLIHGQIQKWGNSLVLRLTGPIRTISKFKAGTTVDVEVTEKWIRLHPICKHTNKLKLRFSETELISGLTPKKAHADEVAVLTNKEILD